MGETFDLWNFPIREDDCYDEYLEDDDYEECPVCGAPYGSCMDIIFEDYGVVIDD